MCGVLHSSRIVFDSVADSCLPNLRHPVAFSVPGQSTVVGGVWLQMIVYWHYSGSTLTICHDNNMTRAMLVKSLHYVQHVCPHRITGTIVSLSQGGLYNPYQPCKAFGKLFTQILPCANHTQSFLYHSTCHFRDYACTDRQTDRHTDRPN